MTHSLGVRNQDDDLEEGLMDQSENNGSLIGIPQAGLSLESSTGQMDKTREVPNLCAICLADYEIGDRIVWASNPLCEHAFHKECIERWLVKQRGNPLCPCCRRDFVLDPLDTDGEGDIAKIVQGASDFASTNFTSSNFGSSDLAPTEDGSTDLGSMELDLDNNGGFVA